MNQKLQTEARRQIENTEWSYDENRKVFDENLRLAVEDRDFGRMLQIFRSAGESLLVIGQGIVSLERDLERGVGKFAELVDWMPFFDTCVQSAKRGDSDLSFNLMLEPTICMLLADESASLNRLSTASIGVFFDPAKEPKADQPICRFVFDILLLLQRDRAPGSEVGQMPLPSNNAFAGYEALLPHIAAEDEKAFESVRARLEGEYPARAKIRNSSLNWYGHGALSQATTFDATGTALCRLAVRRGMTLNVDSVLYPRSFLQDR